MSGWVRGRLLPGLVALGMPGAAAAHGFGRLYNLPVPLWLYAWGASAALVLSFVLVGLFLASNTAQPLPASRDISNSRWPRFLRWALPGLRVASLLVLLLCIATGLWGGPDPARNFSVVFFWVVFVLGFTYMVALLGDFYSPLNPWRVLAGVLSRGWMGFGRGRVPYPAAWGDWPALLLFLGFIWFELFGTGKPLPLGSMLLAYTLLNLAGVGLFGSVAWFRHCEVFAVFLRLFGLLGAFAINRTPTGASQLRQRTFLEGIVQQRPAHFSTVVFVLAMLSSTAFDGLKATQWWVFQFWADPTGIVTHFAGTAPVHAIALVKPWYLAWETGWLLASPFLYAGAYLLALWLARVLTRTDRPLRELALDFGYTLLPIALVYNATHYSTLLLSDGMKVFSLLSDPFGWGWNLFGTAFKLRAPILPDMAFLWHAQVGLILLGHVASAYAAHRVALRVFRSRRDAVLSQLPMLALMVGFTVGGLWILAQPLTVMLMR